MRTSNVYHAVDSHTEGMSRVKKLAGFPWF
mgnify:CR=1 FL=1